MRDMESKNLTNMAQTAIKMRNEIEGIVKNTIHQISAIVVAEPKRTLMFDKPTIFGEGTGNDDDIRYLCGLYAYSENNLTLLYKEFPKQNDFYKEQIDTDTDLELIYKICELINR